MHPTISNGSRPVPAGGELPLSSIRSVYQPIVELDTGAVVGYEALARGPQGTPWERPDVLFDVARRTHRLAELDAACRAAAFAGAKAARLSQPLWLFVNAEPEVLDGWATSPDGVAAGLDLPVMLEVTERALTRRPAEMLTAIARLRRLGWGIALDDVGADPASLALLPLLAPDVIKLDLRLVQTRPDRDVAAVVNAVSAEVERTGALLLAEGLEQPGHLRTARAFGATLGQGWYYGVPGPIPPGAGLAVPDAAEVSLAPFVQPQQWVGLRRTPVPSPACSPFELAAARRRSREADKPLLIEISKQIEEHARAAGGVAVVLSAFQEAKFFTAATGRRYERLAQDAAFVAAIGAGMPAEPLPGVRGGPLRADDPLRLEWDIAVLGPHFAATLCAREVPGQHGPEGDRRFDFVLSHDRELVTEVAAGLMARVVADPSAPHIPAQRPGG